MLIIDNSLDMFRASLCPSSGEKSNSNLHSAHTLNVAPQYRNLPHPTLPANTLHMQ